MLFVEIRLTLAAFIRFEESSSQELLNRCSCNCQWDHLYKRFGSWSGPYRCVLTHYQWRNSLVHSSNSRRNEERRHPWPWRSNCCKIRLFPNRNWPVEDNNAASHPRSERPSKLTPRLDCVIFWAVWMNCKRRVSDFMYLCTKLRFMTVKLEKQHHFWLVGKGCLEKNPGNLINVSVHDPERTNTSYGTETTLLWLYQPCKWGFALTTTYKNTVHSLKQHTDSNFHSVHCNVNDLNLFLTCCTS